MINATSILEVAKKPVVLVGALALVVVVLVWLFVFFEPQSHKLASLDSEKVSLQQTLVQEQARLQQVRQESHHVGQIQAIDAKLKGYVPSSEELYTYIQALSGAGHQAGVTISSLQPSPPEPASGTSYTAIPISAQVKGTYDQLVAFLHDIYNLPRLTDINSLTISGGGPGTSRSSALSATIDLVIFSSETASTSS
jgi:type IV pilus assembly protein PilO